VEGHKALTTILRTTSSSHIGRQHNGISIYCPFETIAFWDKGQPPHFGTKNNHRVIGQGTAIASWDKDKYRIFGRRTSSTKHTEGSAVIKH